MILQTMLACIGGIVITVSFFELKMTEAARTRAFCVIGIVLGAIFIYGATTIDVPDPAPLSAEEFYCQVSKEGRHLRCNDQRVKQTQHIVGIEPVSKIPTGWGICSQSGDKFVCDDTFIFEPREPLPAKDS